MIVIEKGIPLPVKRKQFVPGARNGPTYPWPDMEVGDSFFVKRKYTSMDSTIAHANVRYYPKRFVGATVFDKQRQATGTRIWREL